MCDHATTQLRLAFHVPDDYNLEILPSLTVFLPYIYLILALYIFNPLIRINLRWSRSRLINKRDALARSDSSYPRAVRNDDCAFDLATNEEHYLSPTSRLVASCPAFTLIS